MNIFINFSVSSELQTQMFVRFINSYFLGLKCIKTRRLTNHSEYIRIWRLILRFLWVFKMNPKTIIHLNMEVDFNILLVFRLNLHYTV